jgi:hypothetical protein
MSILVAFAGFCPPPPRHDRCRRLAGAMGGRAKRAALPLRRRRHPACTCAMCQTRMSQAAAGQSGKCPSCFSRAHRQRQLHPERRADDFRAARVASVRRGAVKVPVRNVGCTTSTSNGCRRRSGWSARRADPPSRERRVQVWGRRLGWSPHALARTSCAGCCCSLCRDGHAAAQGSVPSPRRVTDYYCYLNFVELGCSSSSSASLGGGSRA